MRKISELFGEYEILDEKTIEKWEKIGEDYFNVNNELEKSYKRLLEKMDIMEKKVELF